MDSAYCCTAGHIKTGIIYKCIDSQSEQIILLSINTNIIYRVTTCLENREMSDVPWIVRKMLVNFLVFGVWRVVPLYLQLVVSRVKSRQDSKLQISNRHCRFSIDKNFRYRRLLAFKTKFVPKLSDEDFLTCFWNLHSMLKISYAGRAILSNGPGGPGPRAPNLQGAPEQPKW